MNYLKYFNEGISSDINLEDIEDLFYGLMNSGSKIEVEFSKITPNQTEHLPCIYGAGFFIPVNINDVRRSVDGIIVRLYRKKHWDLIINEIPQIEKRLPDNLTIYGVISWTNSGIFSDGEVMSRYDFAIIDKSIKIDRIFSKGYQGYKNINDIKKMKTINTIQQQQINQTD